MADDSEIKIEPYDGPAGGWGSLRGVAEILPREKVPPLETARELWRQNKTDGFACVSCAWPKPAKPHPFEFCENGAKATAWELTSARVTPQFFLDATVSELRAWSDYDLEQAGRLTKPLRYDGGLDRYVETTWNEAFVAIATELRRVDPKSAIFYTSGRASLEASYLYGLFARAYGSQNLPDSSNMCHESTSVGLKEAIGSAVGTVVLEDFDTCDAILFFGQNVGTNSPRMLHTLRDAAKRSCEIITFNPLRERALERFTDPQNPFEMLTGQETQISTQYHQVKVGGDLAAMVGIAKALIARDDEAQADGQPPVIDHEFIAEHTKGLSEFAAFVRASEWIAIEAESGLRREALMSAADVYARSKAVIAVYGMGLTQHKFGVANVRMLMNLLLLRGNIGRPGAGICPVRGHSNVQGQRTVGITEKPELVPLDTLKALYGFEPPRTKGWDTVEACQAVLDHKAKAFIGLGGNFVRAVPDTDRIEAQWPNLVLTVHIATKLNRSHLLPGKAAWLLPCLGRIEEDMRAGVRQAVSIEDSTSCIHGSVGKASPADPELMSETAIVCSLAAATLEPNGAMPWTQWANDYSLIRSAIEATYPELFSDFNGRLFTPGGFNKGVPARDRIWKTESGKAEFEVPPGLSAVGHSDQPGRYRLTTLRSNDQFNTTVYGFHDRFRGIKGTRRIVFMSPIDIVREGLADGQEIALISDADDDVHREVRGLRVVPYQIPQGCLAAYFPECNPLMALADHALKSHVPAAKSVPVRISAGRRST